MIMPEEQLQDDDDGVGRAGEPPRGDTRLLWVLAGLGAGLAGLAVSYAVALALTIREAPVVAVAEAVIRLTPGALAEWAIQTLGHWDKPVLVAVILGMLVVLFAVAGLVSRRAWIFGALVFLGLAGVGAAAVLSRPSTTMWDLAPLIVGFATWLVALNLLTEPLQRLRRDGADPDEAFVGGEARRTFLVRAGVIGAFAVGSGVVGRWLGRGQRHVEETRRLLRLDGVSVPRVPTEARIGLAGVSSWQTPVDDFYLIHTAIAIPTVDPDDWQPADPRRGRERGRPDLPRPDEPTAHRSLDHPQLRLQPGRRRPRRQRLVERGAAGRPARARWSARGRRLRAADLR